MDTFCFYALCHPEFRGIYVTHYSDLKDPSLACRMTAANKQKDCNEKRDYRSRQLLNKLFNENNPSRIKKHQYSITNIQSPIFNHQ
jgi:hypothetical protein